MAWEWPLRYRDALMMRIVDLTLWIRKYLMGPSMRNGWVGVVMRGMKDSRLTSIATHSRSQFDEERMRRVEVVRVVNIRVVLGEIGFLNMSNNTNGKFLLPK